jgi:hypothetical protein
VLIIWVVSRTVRKANARLSLSQSQLERVKVRVQGAENATRIAREQHHRVVGMASQAMNQTGQAPDRAEKIDTVAGQMDRLTDQMDRLLGLATEAATALMPSRPRGRHAALPGQQAVPDDKQTEIQP